MTPVAVQTALMNDCPKGTVIFAESKNGTFYAMSKGGKVYCTTDDGEFWEIEKIGMDTTIKVDGVEVPFPFLTESQRYHMQGEATREKNHTEGMERIAAIRKQQAEDMAQVEDIMRRMAADGKTDCVEILRDALAEADMLIVQSVWMKRAMIM